MGLFVYLYSICEENKHENKNFSRIWISTNKEKEILDVGGDVAMKMHENANNASNDKIPVTHHNSFFCVL